MHLPRLRQGLFLSALLLAACGDDDANSGATCGEGTIESDGVCVVSDDYDSGTPHGGAGGSGGGGTGGTSGNEADAGLTCGDGTVESDGECVARPPTPAKKPVGAACEQPTDCETGSCAISDALPGGYCTILGCSPENPCPVGSTCYASESGVNLCLAFCEGDVDCREGDDYACQPLYTSSLGICAPSCTINDNCSSSTRCNQDTGICDLLTCDPSASDSSCNDDETCWPDTQGLSDEGGLCLHLCDPGDPSAECLSKEVCQPLASDPANSGFCAPPVCSATHECPAGAICQDQVCQPPALCDEDTECEDDDTTCVAGSCLSKCPTGDDTCADIHPDLVCADSLDVPACLPLGSFPGSACRSDRDNACDSITAGDETAAMICQDDICLPDCAAGGNDFCQAIDDTLVCAVGIFETTLCLPKGSFPGAPCDDSDACDQNLDGNADIDMVCASGTCVVDCDESGQWDGYGDTLCRFVDPALTCSESAGSLCVLACEAGACDDGYSCLNPGQIPEAENACLPDGSFPGSACRDTVGSECDQNLSGNAFVDMECSSGTCVVSCGISDAPTNDGLCASVDPRLTCSESASNICVFACDEGDCPTGYSCLDEGGENACLPNGTFPGSACRATVGSECDQNLSGNASVDMECASGTCVVSCGLADAVTNDGLCAAVDPSLTCSETADDICVIACDEGDCPTGYSCFDEGGENACLPNGTFPGSACRATVGDQCDQNLSGNASVDMECAAGTCVVSCGVADAVTNDGLCGAVDPSLTCSESASDICVLACDEGDCPTGYSCLNPGQENACLPDGTFPGSACRATVGNQCDQNLAGNAAVDMECASGTCVVSCGVADAATNDGLCAGVNAALTCSETASDICVVACVAGACPGGYFCFNPGTENACFPIPVPG